MSWPPGLLSEAVRMPEETPGVPELYRSLTDFRNEYRSDRMSYVRQELYRAEQGHVTARLAALENGQDQQRKEAAAEWAGIKQTIRTGIITTVFAVVTALLIAWFK